MDQIIHRRQRLSPEARREMIVDAAVRYFAEVGFSGSTRDLAQRVGVTQPLLYKYFATKADLAEAVFERVYLDRLDPEWPGLLKDRSRPLRERLILFYRAYTDAIFTYEWMRIFMFAGLAGERLNRRYLDHVRELLLAPALEEVRRETGAGGDPTMEDMFNLHGGIVYIGIRRFIYQLPVPEDSSPAIAKAVDRFLAGFASVPNRR
ncbi:MAG: TetR/AcrR family transcriptional regulator [Beijerinckiaceae bacterium]